MQNSFIPGLDSPLGRLYHAWTYYNPPFSSVRGLYKMYANLREKKRYCNENGTWLHRSGWVRGRSGGRLCAFARQRPRTRHGATTPSARITPLPRTPQASFPLTTCR